MLVMADLLRGSTEQRISNVLTLGIFTVVGTGLAVWAWREWRRGRKPVLALLLGGGLFTYLSEPIGVWLLGYRADPAANHPVLYSVAGVDVSMWMLTAYAVYVAGAGYFAYVALERRWPRRRFWAGVGMLTAIEAVGELLWINVFGLYDYVGRQGLVVLGLPVMWPVLYIMVGVVTGALVFFLSQRLDGVRLLALVPIPAGAYAGMLLVFGWPSMLAYLGETTAVVRTVAGLVTLAGMAGVLYAIASLLPARR